MPRNFAGVVPAIIFSFRNEHNKNNVIKIGFGKELLNSKDAKTIKQDYYLKTPKYSFNLQVDSIFIKLQSLIEENKAQCLIDVATIKIGVCTGSNKKFLADSAIFSNSKKVLQGRDINRYSLSYSGQFINYDRSELLRARDESIFLRKEKLLMRQTSDKLILTYDDSQFYTIDSLFIIFNIDGKINLKFLLALLNSKLLNRQYQKLNPEKGRVFAQVKIDFVNELPIVVADSKEQSKIAKIVENILAAKQTNVAADTTDLETQIDQLVYQLYDLTEDEIKIIENNYTDRNANP